MPLREKNKKKQRVRADEPRFAIQVSSKQQRIVFFFAESSRCTLTFPHRLLMEGNTRAYSVCHYRIVTKLA